MAIDKLRYFSAVVETGNLRRAAELVGIAAPSMSKAISVLESELGFKLIHPEGRGIGITAKGLDVYKYSIPLLEENRRFYEKLKDQGIQSNRIRMGTFEVFSSYFISSFLAKEQYREFTLLEMTPGMIERAILEGLLDIGLTYIPVPTPGLEYKPIGTFVMRIFGQSSWEEKPFSEWPFAVPTTALKVHSLDVNSLDLWPKHAPKRKICYQFELLETAVQTARHGISVLHCPDFVGKLHNECAKTAYHLQSLRPPSGYKAGKLLSAYIVARKGTVDSTLERKLSKFMRALK